LICIRFNSISKTEIELIFEIDIEKIIQNKTINSNILKQK